MADVILVHGIANELESADTIEREWLPALAGGVRTAGFSSVADRLRRLGSETGWLDVRAAFYGHLFRQAGVQGAGDTALPDGAEEVVEALALDCLKRAERTESTDQQRIAREELAALGLHEAGEPMGVRALVRSLVARLARLPWFAWAGMTVAERFANATLRQVTLYLSDDRVRATAQRAVLDLVDKRTKVVVAHSLGSVVAYEVCFALEQDLPLLVTIGSPLGLSNFVYQRLRPQPPVFPPRVRRWVNIADRNDVVAAEPNLRWFFGSVREGSVFEPDSTVFNGRDAHRAESYLTAVIAGRPIGETLAG